MKRSQNVPEIAGVGLSLFAAAWFERWQRRGGSVQIDRDGRAMIGCLEYHGGPLVAAVPDDLPSDVIVRRDEYLSAKHDGAMRELLDLLDAVPGGLDAVKAYVKAWAL